MDVIGFGLATAVFVATYAVFGLVIHVVGDVLGTARSAVAPSLLGGFRAWDDELRRRATPAPPTPGDTGAPDDPAPAAFSGSGHAAPGRGYRVPVARVRTGGRGRLLAPAS